MLQIQLLGQFEVRADGKRVSIASRAGQSLLAFLILTAGTVHRREKLAGMFWPDTSDENARRNLRQELWRIRKAIAGKQAAEKQYLLADEFTLGFNRNAEYWLDVSQLERPDLDLPALLSNLSAYRGELLPGFYDDWIALERERIQSVFEARIGQLLEQLIIAERWIAVQEWSERWLALGSTPEPAYRALMLASGVQGDIVRVTALYQRCKAELQEHLGVEPSGETRALYDGLRKGTHSSPSNTVQQSGTITFLFTDIEGSTHLLDYLGDQYATVLAEHHAILRAAIQKWNGHEVDTQGDAFFVTFNRALDAVQCAAQVQRMLVNHSWPDGKGVRVRLGLHTGEPLIASTGYVGMDVHRAARIGDAGHGGQVLLSQSTHALVIHDLPSGVTIRELGEHRLKDLKYPTPIYQLVIDGLPTEFPPLRTKFTGAEAPTPGEPPFKGLQFFDQADSDLFFGREAQTTKLLHRLEDAQSLSVIIGASGSGKSSLVRAGLIPALKKGKVLTVAPKPLYGSLDWQVHVITPTAHPLEALATELTRDSESVTATATLMDDLAQDPRSLTLFLSRPQPMRHVILVIDQFEELFTICRDEFEREAFIDNLLATITPHSVGPVKEELDEQGNITLVLTLRADFYAHLAQYPELREAVAQQQDYIGPMTSEDLRRAIEEPARHGHWEFEPGLVDLILRDVGNEPGALPLLSHALLETWKRRAGHRLTLRGYADAGGVRGAIAYTAENVYQNLSPKEQIITRNLFLRLTELGAGTDDTRRRASFGELISRPEDAEEVRGVLNILAEARLITLGEDTVEVAHEALIREWPTLREWLAQDREGLILHRHLTETAHEWELMEREISVLYRGSRLAQANEWAAINPLALNVQEKAFLEASTQQSYLQEQEREAQLQRELEAAQKLAETERRSLIRLRSRNRVITTIGFIAIILALVAGMFGTQSNQNALASQNNAETAQVAKENAFQAQGTAQAASTQAIADFTRSEAQRLASEANSLLLSHGDSNLTALLAVRSLRMQYTSSGDALLGSLTNLSAPPWEFKSHTADLWSVAFSLDGKYLVTGSSDGTARLWDLATGETVHIFEGHSGQVGEVKFSPDGKTLLVGSAQAAHLWDVASGQLLQVFTEIKGGGSVAFSPDGKYIVTASFDDKNARLWDVATGRSLRTLVCNGPVIRVAYSTDGKYILTGTTNSTAQLWDPTTGKQVRDFVISSGIEALTFSPDSTSIAFGTSKGTAQIWSISTGELVREFSGHEGLVLGIKFSADGRFLLTGSGDRTARLWDIATGQTIYVFAGHGNTVQDVAFSLDGKLIATAGNDGIARVWKLETFPGGAKFNVAAGAVQASFSPDGKQIVVAVQDGTTRIFDRTTGQIIMSLNGPADTEIRGAVFSPDGRQVLTASNDGVARLWDLATGKELRRFEGHTDLVNKAIFSPDGKYIVTASYDGTARVWDVQTGQTIVTYTHQGPGHVNRVAFSPDGKIVATSGDNGTVHTWDLFTGKDIMNFEGHTDDVRGIAFSPDGKYLVTASIDGSVRLWEATTGKEVRRFAGHPGGATGAAFSPDGKYVASGGVDGIAKLWDVQSGQEIRRFVGGSIEIVTVTFSSDGKYILTASFDGNVRLWLVDVDETIRAICGLLTRDLTSEERVQFGISDKAPTCPAH